MVFQTEIVKNISKIDRFSFSQFCKVLNVYYGSTIKTLNEGHGDNSVDVSRIEMIWTICFHQTSL